MELPLLTSKGFTKKLKIIFIYIFINQILILYLIFDLHRTTEKNMYLLIFNKINVWKLNTFKEKGEPDTVKVIF